MFLHIFDTIVAAIAFVVPVYLTLRYNVRGILFGAIFLWLILISEGIVLRTDPNRHVAIPDAFWLYAGWVPALFYCGIIYILKTFILKFRKK